MDRSQVRPYLALSTCPEEIGLRTQSPGRHGWCARFDAWTRPSGRRDSRLVGEAGSGKNDDPPLRASNCCSWGGKITDGRSCSRARRYSRGRISRTEPRQRLAGAIGFIFQEPMTLDNPTMTIGGRSRRGWYASTRRRMASGLAAGASMCSALGRSYRGRLSALTSTRTNFVAAAAKGHDRHVSMRAQAANSCERQQLWTSPSRTRS